MNGFSALLTPAGRNLTGSVAGAVPEWAFAGIRKNGSGGGKRTPYWGCSGSGVAFQAAGRLVLRRRRRRRSDEYSVRSTQYRRGPRRVGSPRTEYCVLRTPPLPPAGLSGIMLESPGTRLPGISPFRLRVPPG